MHNSIPVPGAPCEILNIVPVNPLISKCMIKVCYVGEDPNRNGSIITKEVAREMANSLPGSPIVGFYNEDTQDFEGHNKHLEIKDGNVVFVSDTRPYGFVDLGAKVWFQKFLDDNSVEREYLCTEGFIWTGQYPESQRIIDKGNNQSMELDEKTFVGVWTKTDNSPKEFLIVNEAIISKLCVLGEDVEPCFEGASVRELQFTFEEDFKHQLFSMMKEMKEILTLNEGGAPMVDEILNNEIVEPTTTEEEVVTTEEVVTEEPAVVEDEAAATAEEEGAQDFEEKKCPKCGKPENECECDKEGEEKEDENKKKYNLDEVVEYAELNAKFEQLTQDYEALKADYEALQAESEVLKEFKSQADRKDKVAMIDKFYMLSEEDKKEVVEKIDEYSVEDIEAKLSVICVRNKVNFSLDEENTVVEEETTFNLNGAGEDECVPAWIKSLRATAENC